MLRSFFNLAAVALLVLPLSSSLAENNTDELTIMVTSFNDQDGLGIPVNDVVVSWLNQTFNHLDFVTIVPLRLNFELSNEGLLAAAEAVQELDGDIVLVGAIAREGDGVAVAIVSVICNECPLKYDVIEGYFEYGYGFHASSLTTDSPPPDKFTILARLFAANWLFGMNRQEESLEILETALSNTEGALPDLVYMAAYLAGIECNNLDRPEGAIQALSIALAINPEDDEILSMRASSFDALLMYDQAISDLETALELDPANSSYRAQLGAQLKQAGRYDEAMEFLNPSIEGDPSNAMTWRDRSRTFYSMGDLESALSDIDRSLELEPLNSQGVAMRGIILWEMGRAEEALADFNTAVTLEQDPLVKTWSVMGRANCYMDLGEYSSAITDLEEVLAFSEQFYSAHFLIGKCLLELGDTESARTSLERFLECPVIIQAADPYTRAEMTEEAETLLGNMN